MQNYKAAIQEHCQKNGFDLPVYTSKSVGPPHQPSWTAKVVLGNEIFLSRPEPTRKLAEQSAAAHAAESIQPKTPKAPRFNIRRIIVDDDKTNNNEIGNTDNTDQLPTLSYKLENTLIAVDLENIQPNFKHKVDANIQYFMSSYSTIDASKYDGKVNVIDCAHSDAADHYMTFVIARMTMILSRRKVVIASRDKSSGILAHMLKKNGYDVTHVKSAQALIDLFTLS